MNQELLNYNKALERIGGDAEFLIELLTDLVNQVDENMENLKQAIINNDYENLKTLSHSLKGASANLNVTRLASHFLELEDMSSVNKTEGAIELLDRVAVDRNELEKFINDGGLSH
jgi:two-component system, sensor histidine kinase and response regulator